MAVLFGIGVFVGGLLTASFWSAFHDNRIRRRKPSRLLRSDGLPHAL